MIKLTSILLILLVLPSCSNQVNEESNYEPLISPTQVRPPGFRGPNDPLGEPGSPESLKKQKVPLPDND